MLQHVAPITRYEAVATARIADVPHLMRIMFG
jgi:hypothetical protein